MHYINKISDYMMVSTYNDHETYELDDLRNFLLSVDPFFTVSTKRALKGVLAMLCPITSIFMGINMIRNAMTCEGGLFKKITYTLLGGIAAVGLGGIITAVQLIYVLFTTIITLGEMITDNFTIRPISYLSSCFETLENILRNE